MQKSETCVTIKSYNEGFPQKIICGLLDLFLNEILARNKLC